MQPPQDCKVDAIVSTLLAKIGVAKDANTVLIDGQHVGDPGQSDGIAVGVSDGTGPAVFVRRSREEGLGQSYREEVVVVCSVWSWSGETDVQPRRARCVDLLTLLQQIVADNRTLDGNCDQLNLDDEQHWVPTNDTSGASCAVGFTITATSTGM